MEKYLQVRINNNNNRENKLFNVKGHNSGKIKVTIIWVPSLRNIKERMTLCRVKAPFLTWCPAGCHLWVAGSQETSENMSHTPREHLRQHCDHLTNQVWAEIGLGNRAQPTPKCSDSNGFLESIKYCWILSKFYVIHNLQLILYPAPSPKNLILNDNFSLEFNIPSSGLSPGGIEMMKSKQAHSH